MTTKKTVIAVGTSLLVIGAVACYLAAQAPAPIDGQATVASKAEAAYESSPPVKVDKAVAALEEQERQAATDGQILKSYELTCQALNVIATKSGVKNPETVRLLRVKADREKELGRETEREATMKKTVEIAEATFGPMNKEVAESLDALGKYLNDRNRFSDALPYLNRAYDIRSKGEVDYCDKNAYTGSLLADCLMNLKSYSEADEFYERIVEFYKKSDQDGFSEGQQRAVENLANSLRWQERYKEAMALEKEEIETLKKTGQSSSILMALAYTDAADTAQDAADLASAKKYLAVAMETLGGVSEDTKYQNHEGVGTRDYGRTRAEAYGQLADIYHELKQPGDEMAARERCDANYDHQAAFLDDDDKGGCAENLMKAGACAITLKDPPKATAFYQKVLEKSSKDAVIKAKLLEHKDWLKYFLTASKAQNFKSNANVKTVASQIKVLVES